MAAQARFIRRATRNSTVRLPSEFCPALRNRISPPSSLSHRNIVTIYDVDTAEVDGQPVHFIAMEYVAGKTLDQLIGRKGLRLREALGYAVQIADGLAAAHAAGVAHGNATAEKSS